MVLKNLTQAPKGSKFSIVDAGLIAVAKPLLVDTMIVPLVAKVTGGNAIFGAIGKVVTAGIIGGLARGGNIGRGLGIVSTSIMISAGEDVASLVGIGQAQPSGKVRQTAGDDTFGQANQGETGTRFI